MAELYKCIKGFKFEEYDTEGFGTGHYFKVAVGSVWEKVSALKKAGKLHKVELCDAEGNRLYITAKSLDKYFELVADQPKLSGHFEKRFLEVT